MGNRAVISIKDKDNPSLSPAIYLHWNGGRDSVEGFLEVAKRKYESMHSPDYGIARLTTIICNWFGSQEKDSGLSVGVGCISKMDQNNHDNGVYWINSKFEIVGREFLRGEEQEKHSLAEIVPEIESAQPKKESE